MSTQDDQVDPTQEHGPVRFPPPFVYLGGLMLGAVAELFWGTPNLPLPLAIAAGLAGAAAFVLLSHNSIKNFDKHGTPAPPWEPTTALVTDGLYRFTRNPIYLGFTGFYIGLALAFGILWSLVLLPVVILVMERAVIAKEEPYLEQLFGDDYRTYKTKVRRWI